MGEAVHIMRYYLFLCFFLICCLVHSTPTNNCSSITDCPQSENFEDGNLTNSFSILGNFNVTTNDTERVIASINGSTIISDNTHNDNVHSLRRGARLTNRAKSLEIEPPELEEEWQCGSDDLSKWISESTIDRDCPLLKNKINNCCIAHDACYDDQLGQTQCDDVFCDCLDVATLSHGECNKSDSPTFCSLVRSFGADAYYQAGIGKLNATKGTPEKQPYKQQYNNTASIIPYMN